MIIPVDMLRLANASSIISRIREPVKTFQEAITPNLKWRLARAWIHYIHNDIFPFEI
jgi:hypothetical protein